MCLAKLPGRSRTFKVSSSARCQKVRVVERECGAQGRGNGLSLHSRDGDPVLIGSNTRLGRAVKTAEKLSSCCELQPGGTRKLSGLGLGESRDERVAKAIAFQISRAFDFALMSSSHDFVAWLAGSWCSGSAIWYAVFREAPPHERLPDVYCTMPSRLKAPQAIVCTRRSSIGEESVFALERCIQFI